MIPSFPHRYCSGDVPSGQIRLHVTQYALFAWSTTHVELPGQMTPRHVSVKKEKITEEKKGLLVTSYLKTYSLENSNGIYPPVVPQSSSDYLVIYVTWIERSPHQRGAAKHFVCFEKILPYFCIFPGIGRQGPGDLYISISGVRTRLCTYFHPIRTQVLSKWRWSSQEHTRSEACFSCSSCTSFQGHSPHCRRFLKSK